MKNNPGGGSCKEQENSLSFMGISKKLQFETFEEFCNRADELLEEYKLELIDDKINMLNYKRYIYSRKFCNNESLNLTAIEKCFEWIMSYEYEKLNKNDLYSLLGKIRKENK
jgi:hypothetical protein